MNAHKIKIYLAPFQGITGSVYREVYTRHFPFLDKLFTPFFTNAYSRKSLKKQGRELESTSHGKIPVIPQILSNEAGEILNFAHLCRESGFEEINWNLGCPFKRVAAKKRGSGLLMHPEMLADILYETMAKIPLRLSVKCRLGYESPEEILALIPLFNQLAIEEVIIHARLGIQLYSGSVDIESFDKARSLSERPVVYNGDIFAVDDLQKYSGLTGPVSGWMIGRGLLVDPFLPGDIKGLTAGEPDGRKTAIRKFVDDLYSAYRNYLNDRLHAIHIMKELWEYLAFGFDQPKKVFNLVKKTGTFDDYEDSVVMIFERHEWSGAAAGNFSPVLL